ncbi:hypothetical protein CBM2615_A370014 [Cupriavidus taiwanensis]|uniref:Uncharacterized protein n=1 Tax=Cupriavidus taiwanensis TaxID=164546 RepID=A0A375E2G8_9BURK|nr:hypothetical protein CBM2615_A370014 [Cupriavidus taiwanensis]SOZ62514.1 hypothetical protein CBM2613_A330014 [Cupriavidus taiwanensis]SPA06175.1 hypothetical protein CBM2625_A280015 [Cupriavidus taiwanensis]
MRPLAPVRTLRAVPVFSTVKAAQ